MTMTLGEYLSNPYGKGVGSFPVGMIRDTVEMQLKNDYPSPITYKTYAVNDDHLVIHCKLPSRTKKGVNYDIVIDLDISKAHEQPRYSIGRFPFTVFSNSPSFFYTYAKVFREHGVLCEWLRRKYERKILRKNPDVRNPAKIVGYERSIYTCIYHVFQKERNRSALQIWQQSPKKKYREIAAMVSSQDDIESSYDRAPDTDAVRRKKEEAAAKRREREDAKKKASTIYQSHVKNASKRTPTVKTTKMTSKSSRTKSTAKVKRSK